MGTDQPLESEMVFDGGIVRVRIDTVFLPNGERVERDVVEHKPSVVVLPLDSEGNAILGTTVPTPDGPGYA